MYGVGLAHRPTRADRFKPGRWAHPSRSKQLHTMGNHAPNGIRAHTDRHTTANEPGNLHTREQPLPERHPERTPTATPSPLAGFRIYDKLNLTVSISMGNSAVGRLASGENIQNINLL